MKKLLPKTSKNPQGFTLIELLIVISIIAILAAIGITVFGNLQRNARDARRRADIDAIAKAIEVAKGTNATYGPIDGADFSGGAVPRDTTTAQYSITSSAGAIVGVPTVWAIDSTAPTDYTAIPAAGAVPGAGTVNWRVCARLEEGTTLNVYCRANQQ